MGWAFCGGLRGRRDLFCLRRGPFTPPAKVPKSAPKPRFWNPFRPTSGVSIGRCQTVELTFVLRRERFFISCPLHSTPKRVGLTPTTCNVRGARRKSRNHPVSGGVFFILFAAVGKKYVAKGIPIPIPKKLKKPESSTLSGFFVSSSADPAGPLHCRRSPRGRGRAAGRA